MTTKPVNPFSPDYQSQLIPFKRQTYRRPVITQPLPIASIAADAGTAELGKKYRLPKTRI